MPCAMSATTVTSERSRRESAALHGHKKSVLITAVADTCPDAASGANATFREINKYLNWTDAGVLNALNASTADDLTPADLERASELGRKL